MKYFVEMLHMCALKCDRLDAEVIEQAADEITRLREALAAAEEDARRYRWLRDRRASEQDDGTLCIDFRCDFENYNNLDAAIDAMQQGL